MNLKDYKIFGAKIQIIKFELICCSIQFEFWRQMSENEFEGLQHFWRQNSNCKVVLDFPQEVPSLPYLSIVLMCRRVTPA